MPVTALNTTNLTNQIDNQIKTFLVTSNANFTVGQYIAIGSELMLVQGIAGTTTVSVERGQGGTAATLHLAGTTVFGSSTSAFLNPVRDALGGLRIKLTDSPGGSLPAYFLPLGSRARDEMGNEYILLDFTAATYPQQPVQILSDFTCTPLGVTGRGPVGVVAELVACTSDNWGWVQIFGRCLVMLGMAGVSPSDAANGPTTLSTSLQTRFILGTSLTSPNGVGWTSGTPSGGYLIDGMTVALDASVVDVTGQTSITGHTGNRIGVWLNYPRITYMPGLTS